jgi:hypothetical protein
MVNATSGMSAMSAIFHVEKIGKKCDVERINGPILRRGHFTSGKSGKSHFLATLLSRLTSAQDVRGKVIQDNHIIESDDSITGVIFWKAFGRRLGQTKLENSD